MPKIIRSDLGYIFIALPGRLSEYTSWSRGSLDSLEKSYERQVSSGGLFLLENPTLWTGTLSFMPDGDEPFPIEANPAEIMVLNGPMHHPKDFENAQSVILLEDIVVNSIATSSVTSRVRDTISAVGITVSFSARNIISLAKIERPHFYKFPFGGRIFGLFESKDNLSMMVRSSVTDSYNWHVLKAYDVRSGKMLWELKRTHGAPEADKSQFASCKTFCVFSDYHINKSIIYKSSLSSTNVPLSPSIILEREAQVISLFAVGEKVYVVFSDDIVYMVDEIGPTERYLNFIDIIAAGPANMGYMWIQRGALVAILDNHGSVADITMPTNKRIVALFFYSQYEIIAYLYDGSVIRTINGGGTWHQIYQFDKNIRMVNSINGNIIYVSIYEINGVDLSYWHYVSFNKGHNWVRIPGTYYMSSQFPLSGGGAFIASSDYDNILFGLVLDGTKEGIANRFVG